MADVTGGTPPTGSSPFDVPGDLAEVYDHFGDASMFSVANAVSLPSAGNWPGRTLQAADTGVLYKWNGSWRPVATVAHQVAGAAPGSDVIVPVSAVTVGGLIVKTGVHRDFTSVSFGNEYMSPVTFASPFPTAILHVSLTPFQISAGPQAPDRPFAVDVMSPTQFRVMIPSSGTSADRAYTWMAVGY